MIAFHFRLQLLDHGQTSILKSVMQTYLLNLHVYSR